MSIVPFETRFFLAQRWSQGPWAKGINGRLSLADGHRTVDLSTFSMSEKGVDLIGFRVPHILGRFRARLGYCTERMWSVPAPCRGTPRAMTLHSRCAPCTCSRSRRSSSMFSRTPRIAVSQRRSATWSPLFCAALRETPSPRPSRRWRSLVPGLLALNHTKLVDNFKQNPTP